MAGSRLRIPDPYFAVMAMDPSRRHGGIALIPKAEQAEPLEIRLVPLLTVRGSFEGPGPGQQPNWTHVYVHLPEDHSRPLHSARLVSCGSFEAKFEFRLPPGRYTLQAYSQFADKEQLEGELVPNRVVVLEAGRTDVDLGRLGFVPHRPDRQTLEAKAKADGSWNDYTQSALWRVATPVARRRRPRREQGRSDRRLSRDVAPHRLLGPGLSPLPRDGLAQADEIL